MSYKKWKDRWRLHAEDYTKAWEWIPTTKSRKHYLIGALVIFFILAAIFGEAKASYTFPYPATDKITMDVDHTNGGGTYNCPSVQACYIKVLEAEARGAAQYCNNITIKRNGKIIWWRKYR